MSKREPNPEQKKAIEHHGGVLLSAGAGSGKTFVLVEHIIFLIEKYLEKLEADSADGIEEKIRQYLSSIVLMTFTKKAAGEISLRLNERIEKELNERQSDLWKYAREAARSITVSTIHGFCFKLLSQGFINDFDPEVEMMTELESYKKTETLFEEWFKRDRDIIDPEILPILISNKDSVLSALNGVFSNPEIRYKWTKENPSRFEEFDMDSFIERCLAVAGLSDFFDKINGYQRVEEKPQKAQELLNDLSRLQGNYSKANYEWLKELGVLFAGLPRMPSLGKKLKTPAMESTFEDIKLIRKFIDNYLESFEAFSNNKTSFLKWVNIVHSAFQYMNDNYDSVRGLTFADMEYIVLKGLNNQETRERIGKHYSYLIVDEFQDTSEIQYKIITDILNGDLSKLFSVGDVKQAIYGFRGGEIAVFQKCSEEIPSNYSLKFNYRSESSVIDFNNKIFDFLFTHGKGFRKEDPHRVKVELQDSPRSEDKGTIAKYAIDIPKNDELKSLSQNDLDRIEANAIFQVIQQSLKNSPEHIAVLYRKLAPSKFLIDNLIKNEIPFTAQIKIPLDEDPVCGIFKVLIESLLIDKDKKRKKEFESLDYPSFMLENYLEFLKYEVPDNLREIIGNFFGDYELMGIFEAFRKFIYDLGLRNSNFKNNMEYIESLCTLASESLDSALEFISNKGKNYSVEFYYGSGKPSVTIMTVHASKGLEFPHVILGGIHTNGLSRSDNDYFGKNYGSFLWKTSSNQRKTFKSPEYIFEMIVRDQKEFSESKRLFYVACTRVESRLSWIDISLDGTQSKYSDDSWIVGLRKWEDENQSEASKLIKIRKDISVEECLPEFEDISYKRPTPFFHQDNLGIIHDNGKRGSLGLLADLSVTKLSSISQCPRKFYLQNICKFQPDDIKLEDLQKYEPIESEDENFVSYLKSSAERGILIHDQISKYIKGELREEDMPEENWFAWIKTKLDEYRQLNCELLSEEQIKFSFFGHMVSGIADLVVQGSKIEDRLEIWDFKTGKSNQEKEIPYKFQLNAYAMAFSDKFNLDELDQVRMVLAYVDEEKIVEDSKTVAEIKSSLRRDWQKLSNLSAVNTLHCSACMYGNLCQQ